MYLDQAKATSTIRSHYLEVSMLSFVFNRNVSYDVLTGEKVIATILGTGRNSVTKSVSNRIGGLLQGKFPHIDIRGSDGSHIRLSLTAPNGNGSAANPVDMEIETAE
jgi:hypothetical protein